MPELKPMIMKKLNWYFKLVTFTVIICFMNMNAIAQKERSEIPDKYKWDLTPLFESDEAWESSKIKLINELPEIEKFRGTLTRSSSDLLNGLEYFYNIDKVFSRLYSYCSLKSSLDTRDMKYSSMLKEMSQIGSDISNKQAFIKPEILKSDWSEIEKFIKEEPKLEIYQVILKDYFREKAHILSEPEERIMALASSITGLPYSSFNTFSNAEMPSPEVTLSTGEKVILDHSNFVRYREISNRADRELVFMTYWDNYKKFEATYGEMLYGNLLTDVFRSKARNYNSFLESSLFRGNIPVDVYYALVENVNKNIPTFHRYLELKKRMMGVDTLKYSDLYAPVVKDIELKYPYEKASKLVIDAMAPLGTEYTSVLQKAFNERWIDVYPSTAKMSGAYSSGSVYDVHPYILLNYNDYYNDVSTLAHELGHTMHSWFTNKTQAYPNIDYSTFVAEVASTFNECLLFDKMMREIKADDTRLSLLMQRLDNFKGTLFRQTQFAEYELSIHEAVEQGKPLTGETFSSMYKELVNKYYGHDKGICYIDDNIEMEWAFIPHFYYKYYVYQYSTSFTASITLADRVIRKEKGAKEDYIKLLSSGSSDYPIELLRKAGVDMTTSTPFDRTIAEMNAIMDEIEKILDKK
jgi:oligoendopeptidase F